MKIVEDTEMSRTIKLVDGEGKGIARISESVAINGSKEEATLHVAVDAFPTRPQDWPAFREKIDRLVNAWAGAKPLAVAPTLDK